MKKYILLIAIIIISLLSTNIYAGDATNKFAVCLTDSLNGKERKGLAKWIFFSISAHPEISPYVKATDQTKDDIDKFLGKLLTRLLAEDCPQQTKAAIKEGGSIAMETAFAIVGQVAMQEIMTNQDVVVSMSGFEKYIDEEKLNTINK